MSIDPDDGVPQASVHASEGVVEVHLLPASELGDRPVGFKLRHGRELDVLEESGPRPAGPAEAGSPPAAQLPFRGHRRWARGRLRGAGRGIDDANAPGTACRWAGSHTVGVGSGRCHASDDRF